MLKTFSSFQDMKQKAFHVLKIRAAAFTGALNITPAVNKAAFTLELTVVFAEPSILSRIRHQADSKVSLELIQHTLKI